MFSLNKLRRGFTVFDPWDIMAVVGVLLVSGGAALIYPPAGLIVLGAFVLFAYYLHELTNVPVPGDSESERDEGDGTSP